MVLAFDARAATRDVDAIFRPPDLFRRAAAHAAAADSSLPAHWLNDGVKGFVSERPETTGEGMPSFSHLRVTRPTTEYLFAMKCMAARTAGYDTDGDRADVLFLAKQLGVGQASQALAIVERFYPASRIPVKTAFFLEELLQQRPAMDFHGLALPELGPPPPAPEDRAR